VIFFPSAGIFFQLPFNTHTCVLLGLLGRGRSIGNLSSADAWCRRRRRRSLFVKRWGYVTGVMLEYLIGCQTITRHGNSTSWNNTTNVVLCCWIGLLDGVPWLRKYWYPLNCTFQSNFVNKTTVHHFPEAST